MECTLLKQMTILVVAVGFAGCASAPHRDSQPPERPAEERGDRFVRSWQMLERPDVTLFVQRWAPLTSPDRVIVFHHGLRDHSERYAGWAEQLAADGAEVVALDMRGHGRSSGRRVWLADFQLLVADLHAVITQVRERTGGLPIVLYGHSVGGMVATLYAQQHGDQLAAVALSAPALQLERLPIEAAATRVFAATTPTLALLDTPLEGFSRDAAVVQAMRDDPLIDEGVGPAVTAAALVVAIQRAWREVDRIRIPLLALHGTSDSLTDPRGCATLVSRLGEKATLKLYPGTYHDLQHEPEAPQVLSDFTAFIDRVLGRP